jgi:hypothetical protein
MRDREVSHQRRPPAALQREHRRQVDHRERHAGKVLHVGAVRGVKTQRGHGSREQGGVHIFGVAVAVFVVLNLDQGGLGFAGQSGNTKGVGIGFS